MRKPSSAVEKAAPGAKRILSGMVADTLALAREDKILDKELQQAAEAGDSEAQFNLGQIHFERRHYIRDQNGKLVRDQNWDQEVQLAFQWFRRAADQGHVQAQCQVAFCYESGWGVDQDSAKAFDCLRLAGENGCSEAWRKLGQKLIYGTIHTKPAPQEGIEYMRKAAETGDGIAAIWLSKLYSSGQVRHSVERGGGYVEGVEVTPDGAESTRWLRIAADNGDTQGQVLLAERYLNGVGVAQDFSEAEKWLLRAAESEDAAALFMLGQLYEEGIHVSEDITKAAMWYRNAAEALSQDELPYDEFGAARSLARCYMHGRGVPKDLAEAYMWLKFGAEIADDEDAKAELASLCEKMSQSELTEGKNRYQRLQQLRKDQFGEL